MLLTEGGIEECQVFTVRGEALVDQLQAMWLFAALVFGIIIVPGMDMLFVLANTLTGVEGQGLRPSAGSWSEEWFTRPSPS